jgi:hypothetical protein
VTRVVTVVNANIKRRAAMTLEQEIQEIMWHPEAIKSYHNFGPVTMSFYDYVKMIVTEYHKIAINTYA